MKICIVVPYDLAEEGGVKRHACHVAESLRASGDEVWVIGPSSTGDNHGAFTRGFSGVANFPANGSDNYLGLFVRPWQVWRFMREHRFDVVHLHEPVQPSISYWAAWSAVGAARVCTFHAFVEKEGLLLRLNRHFWGRTLMLPWFDRGITVSLPAGRYAREIWKRPLAIIPNGVPTRTFTPPVDGKHDDAERPLRLLFVGHWRDTRKGLPVLLDAYTRLRERGVAVTLDVIGSGAAPAPLDGVTYHGAISSEKALCEHYQSCDLFVAPATGQESFGIVLLEAMACARPIVCSDIEGYRQVATASGAHFTPPGDAAALALAISAVAADARARRRMGLANRRRAEEFDWDALARRVRDEYVAAIASRHGEAAAARHRPVAATGNNGVASRAPIATPATHAVGP